MELIQFKWDRVAFGFHRICFVNHFIYLVFIVFYCVRIYINDRLYEYEETDDITVPGGLERVRISQVEGNNWVALLLLSGIVYPAVYTMVQLHTIGYLNLIREPHKVNPRFYFDVVYISICIITSLIHFQTDPQEFISKIFMLLHICLISFRTFNYLRIIEDLSPLITMLAQVIVDLKNFLVMFFINIVLFSLCIMILQNDESESYLYIGSFAGALIDSIKMSLGDFEVIGRVQSNLEHYIIFWFTWTILVLVLSIIFLNFIIAEASASYEKVTE